MTGRAYMGEVLTQVWQNLMSELLDKEVNAQKENLKKLPGAYASSPKPTKKCTMKMKVETNKEKTMCT